MTATAVCEVGPVGVRLLAWEPGRTQRGEVAVAEALLAAGDEELAVVGDRVVRTQTAWRQVLTPLLRDAAAVRLIHPSWWPQPRVAMLVDALAGGSEPVETVSRAVLLGQRYADATLIEVAPHLVLVTRNGAVVGAETRSAAADVVVARVGALVGSDAGAHPVCIDAPADVPGARWLASALTAALTADGVGVTDADLRGCAEPRREPADQPVVAPPRAGRRILAAAAVLGVVGMLAGAGLWGWARSADPDAVTDSVALLEGRVSAQIPAGWEVRHVTAGPGSARVEVVAPGDTGAALHITQAPAPGGRLDAVAELLGAALQTQAPGVFVDFNPSGRRAGRPAVTYREVRAGREIDWTVFVDREIRIGIGCQRVPNGDDAVGPACELAVRSARRIN